MRSRVLLPLLLAAVAASGQLLAAAAATADELALALRPAGCTAADCAACPDYLVYVENVTSLYSPDPPVDPCGSDNLYTPVPIRWDANCQKHFPSAWRCIACCSANCGAGGCMAGQGGYQGMHGCAACPPLALLRTLELPASTCRSCFGSNRCFKEKPSKYRICDMKTTVTGQGPPPPAARPVTSPRPSPAARPVASPPPSPAEASPDASPSPVPDPPSPEMLSPEPLPPADAPAPAGDADDPPAPAPAPMAAAPSSGPPPSPSPAVPQLPAPPPSAGARTVGAWLLALVTVLAAAAVIH